MTENIVISPKAVGKDAYPLDTVKRIKQILAENNIETEELRGEPDVPHCHSLRINIKGTSIGANGKGINEEYALASGYGELIERIQLGLIWKNKLQIEGGASSCEAQSQSVSAAQLLKRNPKWYATYAEKVQKSTGVVVTAQEIVNQYADSEGNVLATPFFCLTTKTREHLPTALCKAVYATSGGAAGNTMEEAMVQALSEIVERHHKLRVVLENTPVPEIPEETLQKSKLAYEIICFLRSKGFRVTVKDCSLGTKLPVVCVCIVDANTGKYHTHFGAYPDFDIALLRTLTESFQGRKLRNVARHEDFSYGKESLELRHLMVELVKGTSEKAPQFFAQSAAQKSGQMPGFAGATNRELLREFVTYFRDEGYDVLVRDSSSLGFPTCQIVIPGYSEVLPHRMVKQFDDNRYSAYAARALKNPASASLEDLFGLMKHIAQSEKLRMYGMESFTTEAGLPANLSDGEQTYLMCVALAHISYTLGRTADAISNINKAVRTGVSMDVEYLICLKRYLSMQQHKYAQEDILTTLGQFHRQETVQKVFQCIEKGKNPLDTVVLRCDMQCLPECILFDRCKKKGADVLVRLITKKAKQIDQSAIEELLADL